MKRPAFELVAERKNGQKRGSTFACNLPPEEMQLPPLRRKKKTRESFSTQAGLDFPVSKIRNRLKKGAYAKRIGTGATVYMTAVLEYLAAEILELAGNVARDNDKGRITPHHIQLAVRQDEELSKLLENVTIPSGGVLPNIHGSLLPKDSKKVGKIVFEEGKPKIKAEEEKPKIKAKPKAKPKEKVKEDSFNGALTL